MGKRLRFIDVEGEFEKLFAPAKAEHEHRAKQLKEQADQVRRLRGLIGETCKDCYHRSYCKNKEKFDDTWMLGCRNWEHEGRMNQNKREMGQAIGNVDKILF